MIQHFLIDMTAKLRYNHRTAIRRTIRRTEALMLENLPTSTVFTLADAVSCRKYQVCSTPGADITLLAFDAGEGVSTEQYSGDTLYTVLTGNCTITAGDPIALSAGESTVSPEVMLHLLESTGSSVSCRPQYTKEKTTWTSL